MTGWPVLAFPQAVPLTLVSPRTLGEGDWLDHSVEFWVEMELWKLSFCCKVIGRWNETLWMQLLQARKMRVNSSTWNQNHYKYVQLDVLFNPNKYVLQDFAKSFRERIMGVLSTNWKFHSITKILDKFRFANNWLITCLCKLQILCLLAFYLYIH